MLQNSANYAHIMLHKSTIKLHKFSISFLLFYFNYKIMSISSFSSLAYHQQWYRHEKIGFMCKHYSTYLTFVVSCASSVNCIKFFAVCYTSCKSFTNKFKLKKLLNFKQNPKVKFYVHISSVFSCWVTNLIYLSMYTCINITLNSFCCICNVSQYIFDKTIFTDTPKSCEVCILYIFC